MQNLSQEQLDQITPLVQSSGMRGHLALVYEVIEGRMPGTLYVDNPVSPHTALVCNSNGFFFAFGRPEAELTDTLKRAWWGDKGRAINAALFGGSSAWNEPLRAMFGPSNGYAVTRIAFEAQTLPLERSTPPGYELRQIDERIGEAILDGSGTGGYGIDPWFINIAGGARAYAALGLGLALVRDGQIASICGVCGFGGGEVELEVGTVPAFRGLGLAAVVSAAFMQQCSARGLTPAYSCDVDNVASIRLAHRLGFVDMERINGYKLFL